MDLVREHFATLVAFAAAAGSGALVFYWAKYRSMVQKLVALLDRLNLPNKHIKGVARRMNFKGVVRILAKHLPQ